MAKVSIIDWIVKKLKRCIAIVEDGDTASQAIASGKYVIWKGNAYKASSAISQGDTLSLSNLTAVSDGIGNELNSKILYKETHVASFTTDNASGSIYRSSPIKITLTHPHSYNALVTVQSENGNVCGATVHHYDGTYDVYVILWATANATYTVTIDVLV